MYAYRLPAFFKYSGSAMPRRIGCSNGCPLDHHEDSCDLNQSDASMRKVMDLLRSKLFGALPDPRPGGRDLDVQQRSAIGERWRQQLLEREAS